MSTNIQQSQKTIVASKWFWPITAFALIWFLMDMSAFTMRTFMLDSMLQNMPPAQQYLYRNMPFWVSIVFALEVFGGLVGCLGLVMKKHWASYGFLISLIGTMCQSSYLYFFSDAVEISGLPAVIMPLVAITICSALLLFSRTAIKNGLLTN